MQKVKPILGEKDFKNYGQYLLDTVIKRLGAPSHPKLPEIKEKPLEEYVTNVLFDLKDLNLSEMGSLSISLNPYHYLDGGPCCEPMSTPATIDYQHTMSQEVANYARNLRYHEMHLDGPCCEPMSTPSIPLDVEGVPVKIPKGKPTAYKTPSNEEV